MKKKIIFTTGGTGGHIIPTINLMKHYSEIGHQVLLVTDKRGKNFIKDNSRFKSYILQSETTTNKNILKKPYYLSIIFYSIIKSIFILHKEKPDLIFGLGGYVSFPISFASRFFKIPLVIYESNIVLGRANKYLSTFSKKIFFSKKPLNISNKLKQKSYEVGPILNKKIINNLNLLEKKKETHKNFSILVLGGSQGAEIFGDIIPETIKMLKEKGNKIEIVQQCLNKQKKLIVDFYKENNIKNYIFEFSDNVIELILSSNLVITRCGASTTAEIEYTETPFIAVPLPNSIDNHQYLNAKYYENKGCCLLLEQKNFNSTNLFRLIVEIIKDKSKLESMSINMQKNVKKNVYKNIENQLKEFI
jgi:UDP-N-acetylglucosamine--N-acetylmuramyl-(pentapeptide) pyrophosphoryl-undecaprenol N-acetylglucosamine transferase